MPYSSVDVLEAEFGPIAQTLRKRLGLLVREVAQELGVTRSALSRAEGGDPKLHALAMRAANHLMEKAAEAGIAEPGEIVARHTAYGGITEVVSELRAPERLRIESMLRVALGAYGLKLEVQRDVATVRFGDETTGDYLVRIDLDSTQVVVRSGPLGAGARQPYFGPRPLGRIVLLDSFEPEARTAREAEQINAFAKALSEDITQLTVDDRTALQAVRRLLAPHRRGARTTSPTSPTPTQ